MSGCSTSANDLQERGTQANKQQANKQKKISLFMQMISMGEHERISATLSTLS